MFDPRTRLLLDGPIAPTLLRLAAPNVVVMIVQDSGKRDACAGRGTGVSRRDADADDESFRA